MSQAYQTSYQPLDIGGETVDERERDEDLSPDSQSQMMIHVVPESSGARWNHIEDLDSFFTRLYQYHQHHGFLCMMLQHAFELVQFVFVIIFTTFLMTCVDYDILFRNNIYNSTHVKVSLSEAFLSRSECADNMSWDIELLIILASVFWVLRLIHALLSFFHFWEIKCFYNSALKIQDSELDNMTWAEVQKRVIEVQVEQRMCIHKEELTELDIYHRILRFPNYLLAMVNKGVLPLKYELPFVGEVVFLTKGLKYNIELLLFWGPWAPFKNNWHLNEEFKRPERRRELSEHLSKFILYAGIINLVFFPFVLLWQILYSFFFYAEQLKREPGTLGSRRWSHYGEVYLRHFNELDHELYSRLSRGYRAATQYMNIFSSPLMAIIARHVAFVGGAVFAVLAALSVYDEDVLQVEHVLTLMTALAAILAASRVFIPEENVVWCPELLMSRVLAEVHYLPYEWKEKAHTSRVRQEFSQLFQYKITHMVEELVSPIITPLILIFRLRHKTTEIVDFFRNFTVEVVGVGDVCSFAQMDVRKHGSVTWKPTFGLDDDNEDDVPPVPPDPAVNTQGGKTELSLLHFTKTNPDWKPPQESTAFISALRTQAQKDFTALSTMQEMQEENALYSSINSLSYGNGMAASLLRSPVLGNVNLHQSQVLRGGLSRADGLPSRSTTFRGGILTPVLQQSQCLSATGPSSSSVISGPLVDPVMAPSNILSPGVQPAWLPQDMAALDMSLSTLYLHNLHHRHKTRSSYTDGPPSASFRGGAYASSLQPHLRQGTDLAGSAAPPVGHVVSFRPAEEKTPLLDRP
ncbi:autophagy-related protein 9 [Oratosquilla oratoria]|uniref:autophagy-related protein 9 n=1 Tax=Oratosquilla oratoria TaxID=337810 RepID=UPI003F7709FD